MKELLIFFYIKNFFNLRWRRLGVVNHKIFSSPQYVVALFLHFASFLFFSFFHFKNGIELFNMLNKSHKRKGFKFVIVLLLLNRTHTLTLTAIHASFACVQAACPVKWWCYIFFISAYFLYFLVDEILIGKCERIFFLFVCFFIYFIFHLMFGVLIWLYLGSHYKIPDYWVHIWYTI